MNGTTAPIVVEEPEAIALTESATRTEVLVEPPPVLEYAPPTPRTESLKAKGIRSSLWTTLGFGSSQVIRFASNLILTRLLLPDDFGLSAIVGMVMGMLQQLSDIGLGPAIIQNPRGDDESFLNTAWTLAVLRGAALWAVACAVAWPVSRFYHQPVLLPLICVTGLNGLLLGLNSTSLFQLNRHLQVGKITVLNTAAQLMTTIVTIGVAWRTHSVWAIIAGGLAGTTCTLVVSHLLIPWSRRNRLAWDPTAAAELFRFGGWVFVSTAMTFFANEVDRLIFGRIVSVAVLGVYQQAATLVRMPIELIARLAHMSLYPALARSAELGRDELARKLRAARAVILPLGVAAVIGLALGAPLAVKILYPGKFQDAGWMAQVMAVGLWLTILQASADRTLLAMGSARPLAACNFVNMVATVAFAFLGYYVGGRHGFAVQGFILGVAVGNLGGHLVIEAALAARGIWIYAQDAEYTLILIGVFIVGVLVPRLAGNSYAIAVTWHLLVIAMTCAWAGMRMWKRMR
jgi:O-antigen/teichoic acid export membrane protein